MKGYWWILSGICLTGCVANNSLSSSSQATVNVYNLSKISLGMKKGDVLQVMRHPYSQETFQLGDHCYEIWFYVTRETGLGQSRMVPQNLTPLTFKDGTLVGWGFDYYNYLVKKEKEEQSGSRPAPVKEKPAEEDRGLERALQAPKQSMSATQAPPKQKKDSSPQPAQPASKKSKSDKGPQKPTEKTKKEEDPQGERMQEEATDESFNFW